MWPYLVVGLVMRAYVKAWPAYTCVGPEATDFERTGARTRDQSIGGISLFDGSSVSKDMTYATILRV